MDELPPQESVEPADHHMYEVSFYPDTLRFFLSAVRFYLSRIVEGERAILDDPDLSALVPEQVRESYSIAVERRTAEHLVGFLECAIEGGGASYFDRRVNLSHGDVRFIKSVCVPYLGHLASRRNAVAKRPQIPLSVLEAIDHQIAASAEKLELPIFREASPYPLAVTGFEDPRGREPSLILEPFATNALRARPVALDAIEIRDEELRRRCLDLLQQFTEDSEFDRLDTIVAEATRILEDRLRTLSGAAPECTGVELATYVYGTKSPALRASSIEAEQEALHLLNRGVFGFIRNSVHHRLVGDLQPERVLQIVGTIDYLIWIAEAAASARPELADQDTM